MEKVKLILSVIAICLGLGGTLTSFDVPAVKVSGDNGIYEIATTDFSGTNDAGQFYSGMLHGTVVDGILTLEFSLHIGAMPMPMTCKFISIGD